MTYLDKFKNPRWQKKRLRILERDGWACQLCNDEETELHVHHKKYDGEPWDANDDELITYCRYCHVFIEYLKKHDVSLNIVSIKNQLSEDRNLMYCLVVNTTGSYSVFFITIHTENNEIDQIINMAPDVIRMVNKNLDVIKSGLNQDNG